MRLHMLNAPVLDMQASLIFLIGCLNLLEKLSPGRWLLFSVNQCLYVGTVLAMLQGEFMCPQNLRERERECQTEVVPSMCSEIVCKKVWCYVCSLWCCVWTIQCTQMMYIYIFNPGISCTRVDTNAMWMCATFSALMHTLYIPNVVIGNHHRCNTTQYSCSFSAEWWFHTFPY